MQTIPTVRPEQTHSISQYTGGGYFSSSQNHILPGSGGMSIYTADPASPMETTYVHTNGFNPEGASTMTVQQSQSVPPHPPPNYTEATGIPFYNAMPPNYDSVMMGNEYPPHLQATLPSNNS